MKRKIQVLLSAVACTLAASSLQAQEQPFTQEQLDGVQRVVASKLPEHMGVGDLKVRSVVVENDTPNVHAIAATDGDGRHAVFMVNTSDTQALLKLETDVVFTNLTLLDATHLYVPAPECLQNNIVQLPPHSVALLQ